MRRVPVTAGPAHAEPVRTPVPIAAPRSGLSVSEMADLTPTTRDRTVDLLRAGAIAVVVLWHWVFSVTHRRVRDLHHA